MALHSPSFASAGEWQSKVAEKRANCQKAIPEGWLLSQSLLDTLPGPSDLSNNKTNLISLDIPRRSGIMTERELEITELYGVSSLLESLASGQITSYEMTLAFSKRAAIAQQLTNCLTETFFEEAQNRAKHLDALRGEGKLAGPLHGLPVSLKDTYQVEGTQATIGIVASLGRISSENSALVDILISLGAVLYVKTNVSQLLMTTDSHNNIFGRVLNPWNTMLTAGGSSGGDGALVAFRGSPLGVGTDLVGSMRVPSLCCGIYGFKPSADRIAFGRQVMPPTVGIGAIVPTAGPFASDIEGLRIFMKAVLGVNQFRHDSTVIDTPWRSTGAPSRPRLRLGVLPEDPLFPLHPPVKETIAKAVKILKSHGHTVVLLGAVECHVAAANQVARELLSLDRPANQSLVSGDEPVIPSIKMMLKQIATIQWNSLPDLSAMDGLERLGTLKTRRAEIVEAWAKLWAKHDLDAVISPPAQTTAVEHDHYGWPAYSAFLNTLDIVDSNLQQYPACIIPFGKASKTESQFPIKPGQSVPAYNSEVVEGAPCALQIFTCRMRDEECLGIAAVIDAYLREAEN